MSLWFLSLKKEDTIIKPESLLLIMFLFFINCGSDLKANNNEEKKSAEPNVRTKIKKLAQEEKSIPLKISKKARQDENYQWKIEQRANHSLDMEMKQRRLVKNFTFNISMAKVHGFYNTNELPQVRADILQWCERHLSVIMLSSVVRVKDTICEPVLDEPNNNICKCRFIKKNGNKLLDRFFQAGGSYVYLRSDVL